MDSFTREDLGELLAEREGLCLSLFVPSQPGERGQLPTEWRHALEAAVESLRGVGFRAASAAEFLAPARRLLDQATIGKEPGGLALFVSRDWQRLYRLPLPFERRVALGSRFLITPLLPLLSDDGTFYVLALSQNARRLLRCTRDRVARVELEGVPANLDSAMVGHDVDEPLNLHTRPLSAGRWAGIFHGHGVGIDDAKDDLLRYFQAIDRGLRRVLHGGKSALVLAAVDYLHPIFRNACGHAGLLPERLEGCPDHLSDEELHRRAWPLIEPAFRRERQERLATYRQLCGTGRTACGVEELVPAASRGEVETLFVAADRQVSGQIDPGSGRVVLSDQPIPRDEDLLNVAAAGVLLHKGTVHAIPAAEMPDASALAGIYWLPRNRHHKGR